MIALTRAVSDSIARCELTHVAREPIDLSRARAQHRAYEDALVAAGCEVVQVRPAHDLPDAVFVEDTAIVVPEVAIVTRPGAASRRAETAAVADVLARYKDVRRIEAPATIDGGDVLVAGRRVFIGRSSRTTDDAIAKVMSILAPYGYSVTAVDVAGCLHLKSAVTAISAEMLLINSSWVDRRNFHGFDLIEIDEREPYAANILRARDDLIYPPAYPRTAERIERRGLRVTYVDVSELAKAEGAVTCGSVIFDAP